MLQLLACFCFTVNRKKGGVKTAGGGPPYPSLTAFTSPRFTFRNLSKLEGQLSSHFLLVNLLTAESPLINYAI